MAESGESPQPTRRRVRVFVFSALGVLLVVALWPLKGYRVEDFEFVDSLRCPYLDVNTIANSGPNGKPALLGMVDWKDTPHEAQGYLEYERSFFPDAEWFVLSGSQGTAFASEIIEADVLAVFFCHHNVCFFLSVRKARLPSGKTREQVLHETLDAIRDGIDREVPGVTTFYSPPALRWWAKMGEIISEWDKKLRIMFKP